MAEGELALIVACDMPLVRVDLLEWLVSSALQADGDALVPVAGGRAQPLCAMYNRRIAGELQSLLMKGVRKVQQALASLSAVVFLEAPEQYHLALLTNVNSPADYQHLTTASAIHA